MPIIESDSSAVNACCKVDANLKEIVRRGTKDSAGQDAGPLVVYQCQVCQRKHYIHEVKPFAIGVSLSE